MNLINLKNGEVLPDLNELKDFAEIIKAKNMAAKENTTSLTMRTMPQWVEFLRQAKSVTLDYGDALLLQSYIREHHLDLADRIKSSRVTPTKTQLSL